MGPMNVASTSNSTEMIRIKHPPKTFCALFKKL